MSNILLEKRKKKKINWLFIIIVKRKKNSYLYIPQKYKDDLIRYDKTGKEYVYIKVYTCSYVNVHDRY